MFVITAQAARSRIDAIAAQQFPNSTLLDRMVTPMPVNPACWEVMMLQKEADNAGPSTSDAGHGHPSWLTAEQVPQPQPGSSRSPHRWCPFPATAPSS